MAMEPAGWAWAWAAGAAGCGFLFYAAQPWSVQQHLAWTMVRRFPGSWIWPAVLWLADTFWRAWQGALPQFSGPPAAEWLASTATQGWHGWTFANAAGGLAGLLLICNAGGMRRGLIRGTESVFGTPGWKFAGLLVLGWLALAAHEGMGGFDVPVVWRMAVTFLAVPIMGWVAATLLAGLLLLAETLVRDPESVQSVRWLESAAAHSARLWPWVLVHGLVWWGGLWLPAGAWVWLAPAAWAGAFLLLFAPLHFLHVKTLPEARSGFSAAIRMWWGKGWQGAVGLLLPVVAWHAWYLAGRGLDLSTAGALEPVRLSLAVLHRVIHIGLTVMGLGAWVSLRLAGAPPPVRPRRNRRAKPS